MNFADLLIVILLAAWFILTIVYTLFNSKMAVYTRRWDVFRWLTSYQMYADTPRAFVLYYRDRAGSGMISDWQKPATAIQQSWYKELFFSENMITESLYTIADDLGRLMQVHDAHHKLTDIKKQFKYRTIIKYLQQIPHQPGAVERQFKIDEVTGITGAYRFHQIFVSEFHQLPA